MLFRDLSQSLIQELLEVQGPFVEFAVARRFLLAASENFVSEIQSCKDGEPEHIARRGGFLRGAELLVDVGGELDDVGGLERAANGVPLSGDFDGDDSGLRHVP